MRSIEPVKGKFWASPIREYVAECASCSAQFVIHYSSMSQAIESGREGGWRIRRGLWHCPACVAAIDATRRKP